MNDTWLLDVDQKMWRRAAPDLSPSPRAGHALQYLPQSGRIALYEGYASSNNTDYSARPSAPISPVQLWLYDVKSNRWSLNQTWTPPAKGETGRAGRGRAL